jgi:dienelactone hydrolase
MRILLSTIMALVMLTAPAWAEIVTETIEYEHDGTVLEGFLAYDDSIKGKRPGVVIVHQWKGLTEYEMMRSKMLAKLGYVAFAADIYGKGVRAANSEDAKKLATAFYKDRGLMKARVNAAYDELIKQKLTNTSKTAVMGYCFGGTVALDLARSGAPVLGTVTFHGGLANPTPENAKNIKGKVLVLHGAADKVVPPEQVAAFQEEMGNASVDWYMVSYAYARHAFTHQGPRYNEPAERRSWEEMEDFFKEIFSQ